MSSEKYYEDYCILFSCLGLSFVPAFRKVFTVLHRTTTYNPPGPSPKSAVGFLTALQSASNVLYIGRRVSPMSFSLAVVQPFMSVVLPIPLEDAWAVVRDWGDVPWIPQVDQRPVSAKLTSGGSPTSVGASRLVKIGDQQWHERLVALDDETHTLKWRLISHADTVNPFTASFVNYMASIKLHGVTEGNQTFLVWRGEFFTEHDHAEGMKDIMERWYRTSAAGLQEYVLQPSRQQTSQLPQGQNPISGQAQYAHAMYPGGAAQPAPSADPSTTATGYSGSVGVQGSPFQNYAHDSYHSNGSTT